MPNRGLRRLRNLYGERLGKAMPFRYDGEDYVVPLKGEVNEISGDVSTGNDLWPVDLAEFAARYMVERIILDDPKYHYDSVKPRGMTVKVRGGVMLQDEDLKLQLLEQILGPKPTSDGKQTQSTKDMLKEQMKLAKEEADKEFEDLEESEGSTFEEIEEQMTWNDIQKAAKDLDITVSNKEDTIKALVAKGYKIN